MYKNQASIKKNLSEVRSVLKRRVRLSLLEDKFDSFNNVEFMDVIVPEAIEQLLFQREYSKRSLPEVIITEKPIIGNLFFIHLQSCKQKVTLCSISDWESYSPPSMRSFLLYTGIRTLLHFKYRVDSHYATRRCILDRCKSKTDIKYFLNPDQRATIFCDECYKEFSDVEKYIDEEILILNQWVKSDYARYAASLEEYNAIGRPALNESLQNIKRLQTIELLSNFKINLYPSRQVYSYLAQYFHGNINELFKDLKDKNIDNRIKISSED